jgi:hypothetical protein
VILSSKAHYALFKKAGGVANHLLSFVSLLGFVALLGVTSVWIVERAPSQSVIATNNVIEVHAGAPQVVQIPIVVRADVVRRAVYRTILVDRTGTTIYQFPDQAIRDPKNLDLREKSIELPGLHGGRYELRVKVIYQFNPIKNGDITMTVATIDAK